MAAELLLNRVELILVPETQRLLQMQIHVRLTDGSLSLIREQRQMLFQSISETLEELGPEDADEYVRIQKRIVQNYQREQQNG